MSEKFNYREHDRTEAGWALMSVLSILTDKKMEAITRDADGNYDILLTVNGVECKFSHIIKRLNDDYDHRVKVQAARMINTLASREFMAMADILDQTKIKLRELCGIPDEIEPEIGLDITVEDILKLSGE